MINFRNTRAFKDAGSFGVDHKRTGDLKRARAAAKPDPMKPLRSPIKKADPPQVSSRPIFQDIKAGIRNGPKAKSRS